MREVQHYPRSKNKQTNPAMKNMLLFPLLLSLAVLGAAPAVGQVVSPVDSVFPATRPADNPESPPPQEPVVTDAEWRALLQRLETLEARLGAATRPPSIAYNMERRIADLERRLQQLEMSVTRLQSLDSRVRKLEMK